MLMLRIIQAWFNRYFSDPEAVLLFILLLVSFTLIISMGDILIPVFVGIVITYLLQWWVVWLEKYKVPHVFAYYLVFLGFLAIFVASALFLVPLLWKQIINLFLEMPAMLQNTKITLLNFIEEYPAYFSEDQINTLATGLVKDAQIWGKQIVSISLSSIPGVITWLVYLILVPLLVFFFLKDHKTISTWFIGFLPKRRELLQRVWQEMNEQIGNYIRGKITEIIIVGFATYVVFFIFDLRYKALLACLVGLSVVIPYIGAVVVSIPVILVGYLQWGWEGAWTGDFAMMLYAYLVVQVLDGNVLVPLLFSEAVNLHPIAIIISILIFGSIWGFWGVFFAIPLATLCKAVLYAWPRRREREA